MSKFFEKKEIFWKYILLFIFSISFIFFFEAWRDWPSLLIFSFAYLLAILLMIADEQFLYKFYQNKSDESIKNTLHKNTFLLTRSFYFIFSLLFISFYVLTSTGSVLMIAFVMAINLFLLIEILQLRSEYLLFTDRFFKGLGKSLSQREINKICISAFFYFLFLILVWIF